jgi:chromosome condensin MukBEF complex kleisin-like MukF subunit
MSTETKADLRALQEALDSATQRYQLAKQEASLARNDETEALNRVNTLQAKIDAVLEEMRKRAPNGSDWRGAHR